MGSVSLSLPACKLRWCNWDMVRFGMGTELEGRRGYAGACYGISRWWFSAQHVGTGASLVYTLPRIFGRLSNFMLFVLKNEFLVESL
jgi:hypothetical protein